MIPYNTETGARLKRYLCERDVAALPIRYAKSKGSNRVVNNLAGLQTRAATQSCMNGKISAWLS